MSYCPEAIWGHGRPNSSGNCPYCGKRLTTGGHLREYTPQFTATVDAALMVRPSELCPRCFAPYATHELDECPESTGYDLAVYLRAQQRHPRG